MGLLKKKNKWWTLLVTTSGTSLVFLDNTVMPVALPTIQGELGFSAVSLVWVVNAYLLSLTSLLLIGGRLSDIFGKRTLFVMGLSLFGLGSILSGFGMTRWALVLGRVVQGAGGALTVPTTSALLISIFPEGQRAKVIGINTGISSIFLILGPALGGLLTQYLSWRWIFFLNIPLVIFGITIAFLILKGEEKPREGFHFSGALVLMGAIVALVVGLMQANEWGWKSYKTLTLVGSSPFLFGLFYWISTHTKHPLIDFSLFKKRLYTMANLALFLVQVVIMVTVLWAIYFQKQLNYGPAKTGLIIFIAAFPVFMMAPLAGYISDRIGPKKPMLIGFAILTFGLFWLMFTANTTSLPILLPGLFSFGTGIPLIMSPAVALALSQSPPPKLGVASGISIAVRQLASTFGIAFLTAISHSTLVKTGSHVAAFAAISVVAGWFSLMGFFTVLIGFKTKSRLP